MLLQLIKREACNFSASERKVSVQETGHVLGIIESALL